MTADYSFGFLKQPGGGSKKTVPFPDPWMDPAWYKIPRNLRDCMNWAEFIWMNCGPYARACQRIGRYFITELQVRGTEAEEAKEIREMHENEFKTRQMLARASDNFMCYGNFFCYMNMPFKRHLRCQCGMVVPFTVAHDNGLYAWRDYTFFKAGKKCPNCGTKHGHLPWEVQDEYSTDASDMRVQFLNIHEVEIGYSVSRGRKEIHWNIPGHLKSDIDKGVVMALEDTQWEVIQAVKENEGKFTFDSEMVFHASDYVPDGIYTGGWGIPRVIQNFRLAHQYQTLHRLDQAICDDYIAGMRVISPEGSGGGVAGGSDPVLSIGGARFRSVVEGMVEDHRRDPASWHVSGFPLKYQLFGGEGTNLVPKDLKEAVLSEWLDALGFPSQLWHGDITVQAAPMALRLFENMWPELVAMFNNLLEWQANFSVSYLGQPEHTISLTPVRFADDIERKQIMLQLMAGNQVSPQTALRGFGIKDPEEELRLVMEWERIRAQREKEFSDDMQQLADADMIKQDMAARAAGGAMGMPGAPMGAPGAPTGGMPAGGAPAAGGAPPFDPSTMGMGGGQPGFSPEEIETPEAMQATAERLASEIMQMDGSARRSALINLKKSNETLHALVKSKLETMENAAAQQGVQQARQGGM